MEQVQATGSAFGALLRRHRVAAGLSQEALAERARMSVNGIGALERGTRHHPYGETVALLAKALNLPHEAAVELREAAARPRSSRGPREALTTLANNLPLHATSLVGREAEVAKITALLADHRLVTVVGSGGVGKTRASLQVAANDVDGTGHGVWLVELAPVTNGDYVPSVIAQAAGVTLDDGDPITQLVVALKAKYLLLVLDNCEHLVDDTARVVSALVKACPRVKILATSRQALGVADEVTYRMPSLPVPPSRGFGAADLAELTADDARRYAAIGLFVERAQAVNDRFVLTDENAPVVATICGRLDGIAMAIELAAARMKMLSATQLRDRLDERFRVLTGGHRDRLPRQQTLWALIDWSHALLDEREQRLFRRLAIFANGFTLEAATAVGGGDGIDEFAVFDVIASLVEKSLLTTEAQGDALRYYLLESTRAYAAEKLAQAGERDRIARLHLDYFCDWFEELEREAHQIRETRSRAFQTERDDIRFALDAAPARGQRAEGARLLAAVSYTWVIGGLEREGIARLRTCIAELPSSEALLVARLSTTLTDLHIKSGQLQEAADAGRTAVRCARAAGDPDVLAFALKWYADARYRSRDFAAAEEALSEAEGITVVSPLVHTVLLELRALLSIETGDLDTAARLFINMRDQARSTENRREEAFDTHLLAEVEFRRERYQRAADLWRDAVVQMRAIDEPAGLTEVLVRLGSTLAVFGDLEAATAAALETVSILAHQAPRHVNVAIAVELRSYIAALEGNAEFAALLAGYSAGALGQIGCVREHVPQTINDRLEALLQTRLAPEMLARLTDEGAGLAPEVAIALARSTGPYSNSDAIPLWRASSA